MENTSGMIETLFERTEEYAKTSLELIKLKTLEKSSNVASSVISRFILTVVFVISMIILSIGIALWLGEHLTKSYYGFLLVGAFYALAGIVLYLFYYKRLRRSINDSIIKNAM